jgi:hypothetical protein
MSHLLFLDESGHDRRQVPYEIHGGIALHVDKLWPFIQAMKSLEEASFGGLLHQYKSEIKGSKQLEKKRFRWAGQGPLLDDRTRRKHSLAFLNKGLEGRPPSALEFQAYGQASLAMARGVFELLLGHGATLFASAIPRTIVKPTTWEAEEYLRKDMVYLLERFFYFLDERQASGLLVMDETERADDRRFVRRLERYFTLTLNGRFRSTRIVASPFFVASDMTYPVQAADLAIYSINHAFRIPGRGMNAPVREEIVAEFLPWLKRLQYRGTVAGEAGEFQTFGIAYVADPYGHA